MSNIIPIAGAREKAVGRQAAPSPQMARIYLLGTMRALAPSGEDMLPRSRKTRALLGYLCLAAGAAVPRSRLAGLFWEMSANAHARMSLRRALLELNEAVNARAPGLIAIHRQTVGLDRDACWIDAFTVSDRSERLLEDLDGISPSFDQWLAGERTRFEDRVRGMLELDLNRLAATNAAPELRAAAARRLINIEPSHEAAVRSLMTAFAEMGDCGQAIREFERCRTALRTSLDLPPSKETTALYEAVRLMARTARTMPRPAADIARQKVLADAVSSPGTAREAGQSDEHGQPSIAVLPFRSLSAEAQNGYVAEGLVEDLIEALSRVPNFFVISRLSTSVFRNQQRLPQEIGELLGVRYVLSGSMRVIGSRLRLTAELTDTRRGGVLWASKLDEQFFDLLEVQNRLSGAIVARVAPYLYAAELKRARSKRPDDLRAYDLFLRAQENMHNSSRTVFESSERMFDEALARAPDYAAALAWRAYWHVLRVGQGWSPDPNRDAAEAEEFARRAVTCDALEPMAFAVQGHIASYLAKDFDRAFELFDAALRSNPNAAPAWLWSAAAHAWIGDGRRAVEQINRAIALSPFDPLMYAYSGIAGVAYLADGQFERAIECGLRCMRENRSYTTAYKLLTVALVLAGRELEARSPAHQLVKLDPSFTVERFRQHYPGGGTEHGELYSRALARAGVPLD